ncbi:MAG: WhiB family transcriptional regulator [Aeromicrobium sp.]|uniref:WhiB family transcriptional regulator n=1 Tax=Aeromicrobium sp. TaxID=1871063 RepID=UPI0025C2413D|nr:WhiB family transcriptional regulator [Aeromicrobium sp.]MCK5890395.1 WhiB family transcriptional regulator [Aeromicrobium sp.]MDF1704982.1 WhiB family transcriptional regulator [Aeromicrobium sp.]
MTFLDDALETPLGRHGLTAAMRREVARKRAEAHRRCAACPIFTDCLYRAVVEVNVSGFVACTTESDRQDLRRRLGVSVADTEIASFGAARLGGGPVDHATVLATRQSHPDDTCQQLAERLGCSTSTIKRHLRRARQQAGSEVTDLVVLVPSVDQVLDAFDDLESGRRLMQVG